MKVRTLLRLQIDILVLLLVSAACSSVAGQDISVEEDLIAEQSPRQVREDLVTLESELSRIESQFDAYDPAIAEVSRDIADRLVERGRYSDALIAYRRTLHILRINNGLDTEQQIPVLENIVQTHYRAGEMEEAGETLDRLSLVYSKNYGEMNSGLIPHLISRGKWHLSAFYSGGGANNVRHLQEASHAYSRVVEIRERNNMQYDPSIYGALSTINYDMAVIFENSQALGASASSSESQRATFQSFGADSYRRGKRLLERGLIEASSSPNPQHRVLALVYLADWEQLFRRRFTAREMYIQAHLEIQALPEDNQLRSLLDTPTILPSFVDSSGEPDFPKRIESYPVAVTMEISAWGTSRNVILNSEAQEVQTRNIRAERLAVRRANGSLFRPRIENGEAVKTENVHQTMVVSI